MKYLAIMEFADEPDNNTPAGKIVAQIIECEPSDQAEMERTLTDKYMNEHSDVYVSLKPLDDFNEPQMVAEIWN